MNESKLPPADASLALAGLALLAELRENLGKPGLLGAIARIVYEPTEAERRCAVKVVRALAELHEEQKR